MKPQNAAALVAAGMLSVLIYPLVGMRWLRAGAGPGSGSAAGGSAAGGEVEGRVNGRVKGRSKRTRGAEAPGTPGLAGQADGDD